MSPQTSFEISVDANWTLYIEDHSDNRNEGLRAIKNDNIKGVIAPNSKEECEIVIAKTKFGKAIIDFYLTEWVGRTLDSPLSLGDTECRNGIELAEYLLKINPEMEIGIFSSNENDLTQKLEKSKYKDKIEIVTQRNAHINDVYKFLPDFIKTFFILNVFSKPLHRSKSNLPLIIESFYNKKLIGTISADKYYWKAGKYFWVTEVKKEKEDLILEDELNDELYTTNNQSEKYILAIDKTEFTLKEFIDLNTDHQLSSEAIQHDILSDSFDINRFIRGNLLQEYYINQIACKEFLDNVIAFEKFDRVLGHLSETTRFESQKRLFKGLKEKFYSITKEGLYDKLDLFYNKGYPRILEIFIGTVMKTENDSAHIKLESVSDPGISRKEQFNIEFINSNYLEENSQFEYTVWTNKYIPGVSYHIEPL